MSGQGKGPRVKASDGAPSAWAGEFNDELRAVAAKYVRIAGNEGASAEKISGVVMTTFLGVAALMTPHRCERSAVEALGMLFDDYRPGWRRAP
jgi:hypothetical protein